MLRSTFTLPLRLLRDAAPAPRYTSTAPLLSSISTAKCQISQSQSQSQSIRAFSSTQHLDIKRRGSPIRPIVKLKKKKRFASPQAKRASEARERKNVARQAELQEQRALAHGDPVWGQKEPTKFVRSWDSATDIAADEVTGTSTGSRQSSMLNDFVRTDELQANLEISKSLTAPNTADSSASTGGSLDPSALRASRQQQHQEEHDTASEAINRILAVNHAGSKGRKHINIQRCIDKFGRHNTDAALTASSEGEQQAVAQSQQRIGPDTGSSEVQIALLTLKIRKLAQEREGPLRQDKINKRNLRVMLHKRQKLMKYFWKKNRGGPRWQHLVDTLGLTDANWKGEIMLA